MDAVLSAYPIDYVKWDHNRDLLEAGSGARRRRARRARADAGVLPAARRAARARTPTWPGSRAPPAAAGSTSAWLEKVQRFWTSDMTDAVARQQIQRWTTQLVAPEYARRPRLLPHLAHHRPHAVAGLPRRHGAVRVVRHRVGPHRGRRRRPRRAGRVGGALPRAARRCCTPGGGAAGVARTRPCCCTASSPPTRSEALLAHVQLDESAHNRGVSVRVPGWTRRRRTPWPGRARST